MDGSDDTTLSRRSLLRTTGAGAAGLAAVPGLAAAQEQNASNETEDGNGGGGGGDGLRILTRGIMPETGRITRDQDYTGFFVQLTARLEDIDVGSIGSCSFMDWDPENTNLYETQVIDRTDQERESIASTLYLPSDTDLRAGDLLVIDEQHNCSGEPYIGVQLENILASNRTRGYTGVGATGDTTAGGGGDAGAGAGSSGAFGPGFGPLVAVGGLAGGTYALARRSGGEE
jgi:hypothetical protein